MAWTPRTFSRRGYSEAKAGENIGQGKPRDDVTEKAKQTDQQKQISAACCTTPSFPISFTSGCVSEDQASVSTGLCRAKAHPKLWSINSPRIVPEPY